MKNICVASLLALAAAAAAIPLRAYQVSLSFSSDGQIMQHKWSNKAFPIQWRMNPVQGANVTGSRTQQQVIAASFATWQALTSASVSFTQGAPTSPTTKFEADGINTITTNTSPTDLPLGVLALTFTSFYDQPGQDGPITVDFAGQLVEADMLFNVNIPFTTSTTAAANRTDLQSVATHEIGHLLGLDHSALVSATMFWSIGEGFTYPRTLSSDDITGISILYPAASFASKGTIRGTVRTTNNLPVYGAVVVAVNSSGTPVASIVTDPNGAYTIQGLDPGTYTVYAEPLDGPVSISNISSLTFVHPGLPVNSTFATRSR